MSREIIYTDEAPKAIGTYSQAIKIDKVVYLSGQIPLVPDTMELIGDEIEQQITQVFRNLNAVAKASGGSLTDIVKLNVYLTDLQYFPQVNEIMSEHFCEPYPARAAIGVAELPKGAQVEMDAVLVLR